MKTLTAAETSARWRRFRQRVRGWPVSIGGDRNKGDDEIGVSRSEMHSDPIGPARSQLDSRVSLELRTPFANHCLCEADLDFAIFLEMSDLLAVDPVRVAAREHRCRQHHAVDRFDAGMESDHHPTLTRTAHDESGKLCGVRRESMPVS